MKASELGKQRTTIGGVLAAISALALIGSGLADGQTGFQDVDWTELLAALGLIGSAISGVFARDNNVSDQEAGARPEPEPTPAPEKPAPAKKPRATKKPAKSPAKPVKS